MSLIAQRAITSRWSGLACLDLPYSQRKTIWGKILCLASAVHSALPPDKYARNLD